MKTDVITKFENDYLVAFKQLAEVVRQKRQAEKNEKQLKEELENAMQKYGITSIDNEFIKITQVEASESTTVDLTKLKKKEPELYEDLERDYTKISKRKAYLRFTIK